MFLGYQNNLRIIYPQGICTSEGYNGTFIAHCHDEHDVYAELKLKEDKPDWQKAEPFERFYVKYDPNNNLPTHESTPPIQRENEVKALESAVCVTNKDNQNLTPSQKGIIRCQFRLGHIRFQHAHWLIHTGRLKVQVNSKEVANCEMPICAACVFGMGHSRPNKVNKFKNNPRNGQELNKDHLLPVQMVSADHYISRSPSRLYHTKGK